MLILTAINVTTDENGERKLERADGMSDYLVEVAINTQPPIWAGPIMNHKRSDGAAELLRRIADKIDGVKRTDDSSSTVTQVKPDISVPRTQRRPARKIQRSTK